MEPTSSSCSCLALPVSNFPETKKVGRAATVSLGKKCQLCHVNGATVMNVVPVFNVVFECLSQGPLISLMHWF